MFVLTDRSLGLDHKHELAAQISPMLVTRWRSIEARQSGTNDGSRLSGHQSSIIERDHFVMDFNMVT